MISDPKAGQSTRSPDTLWTELRKPTWLTDSAAASNSIEHVSLCSLADARITEQRHARLLADRLFEWLHFRMFCQECVSVTL